MENFGCRHVSCARVPEGPRAVVSVIRRHAVEQPRFRVPCSGHGRLRSTVFCRLPDWEAWEAWGSQLRGCQRTINYRTGVRVFQGNVTTRVRKYRLPQNRDK
jgi:hypothetical protein